MTKHQGLAQPADTANPDHYPIRQRGEKRRLAPNWVGIAWLEAEQLDATEIVQTFTPAPEQAYHRYGEGIALLFSAGGRDVMATHFRARSLYIRPMFQILLDAVGSAAGGANYRGCATCYDLQYPGRECAVHNDSTKPREQAPRAYVSHTCALAGRGDCVACAAQSSTPAPEVFQAFLEDRPVRDLPPEAFAEPGGITVTDAINEEMRLDRSLWEGIREAAAETPEETAWQELVRQYQRMIEQEMGRARSLLRPDRQPLADDLHLYTYTPPREVPRASAIELRVDGETIEGVQSFTIHFEEGSPDER